MLLFQLPGFHYEVIFIQNTKYLQNTIKTPILNLHVFYTEFVWGMELLHEATQSTQYHHNHKCDYQTKQYIDVSMILSNTNTFNPLKIMCNQSIKLYIFHLNKIHIHIDFSNRNYVYMQLSHVHVFTLWSVLNVHSIITILLRLFELLNCGYHRIIRLIPTQIH